MGLKIMPRLPTDEIPHPWDLTMHFLDQPLPISNAYQTGVTHYLTVWPLQLIYSDIAWYLLHEDCQNGHFAASRLDRFSDHFKLLDVEGRGSTAQ